MTQIITTSSTTDSHNIIALENTLIYIAEGVTIASILDNGLHSDVGLVKVHVLGSLVGGLTGATLEDDLDEGMFNGDFRVTIGATGSITGDSTGLSLSDDGNTVSNQGEITGYRSFGVNSLGADFRLVNSGTIVSHGFDGVISRGASPQIINYGLIQGGDRVFEDFIGDGVDFSFTAPGDAVTLKNYGTISAAVGAAVRGDTDGVDNIYNFGLLDGDVLLDGGNDLFRNGGQVVGNVDLGSGDDVFRGRGGTVEGDIFGGGGDDIINGGGDDDILKGGSGNDVLRGGLGEDALVGGDGIDRMVGGADADIFYFNSVLDSGPAAVARDRIKDFEQGLDLIDLSFIDADTDAGGDQAFTFIGSSKFFAPGQVRIEKVGGNTVVQVSNESDTSPEMAFTLIGEFTLTADDFVL